MSKPHKVQGDLAKVHKTTQLRAVIDPLQAAWNASLQMQMIAQQYNLKIEKQHKEALAFLFDQQTQRTVRCGYIQRAITAASNDYMGILLTEAAKPLDLSLFATFIALSVVPEFLAVSQVCRVLIEEWKGPISELKAAGKFLEIGARLDSGSGGKDRGATFSAANQVLMDVYDRTLEDEDNVAFLVATFTRGLMTGIPEADQLVAGFSKGLLSDLLLKDMMKDPRGPLPYLLNYWRDNNMEILPAVASVASQQVSDLMSNIMLYDMLRAYTRKYVSMSAKIGPASGGLPDDLENVPSNIVDVRGLDGAQRQRIYDRFSTVPWKDPSRPPVNNWRDLIQKWGAKK